MSNLIGQVYRLNAADEPKECDGCQESAIWAIAGEDRKEQRYVLYSCSYDLASTIRDVAINALGPAMYKPEL